ncbi:MAG TPA: hypothetical protein ENI85_13485 [Deltaproteobacteria bacterium]|nr:hypothetical protein [Deltaproteobacteria bacterium]
MPILDARHDRMHPVEGESAWSESYYFNGYDPHEDVGLYTRIGIRPNEGTMDVMLASWQPGNRLAFARAVREQDEMCESPLEVGGVRYACLEEGRRWRLTADCDARLYSLGTREQADTRLVLDLEFEALMPMVGVDGQGAQGSGASAATGQATGKGHLEQAGRWSGWIEADGKRLTLGEQARGNRDKSWGPRRWGGPKMWRWFSINISDDIHFGGIRIGTDAGDLHRGWVWRDGELTSLVEWRIRTETRADGITQKTCFVTAVDKRGREHVLRGDVLRVFPGGARAGRTVVNEGLTRWTLDGMTGHGIAEYLHQFDDEGRPLVPIE